MLLLLLLFFSWERVKENGGQCDYIRILIFVSFLFLIFSSARPAGEVGVHNDNNNSSAGDKNPSDEETGAATCNNKVGGGSDSETSGGSGNAGDERSSSRSAVVPLLWQPRQVEETTRSYSPFPPPIPPPPSSSSSCIRSGAATSFASPLSAVSAIELASSRSVAAAAANANSGATCQGDPAQQLLSQVTQEQQANRWTSNTSTLPPVPSAVSSAPSGVLVRQVSRFSVMQTSLDGDPMPSVTLSVGDPCASANGGGGSGQPSSHNQSRRQRGRSGRNREGSSSNGGGHSRARRQRSNMSAASASGTSRASTPDTPIVRSRRSAGKFCLKFFFFFRTYFINCQIPRPPFLPHSNNRLF